MRLLNTELNSTHDLPEPETVASSHSRRLCELIREEISLSGGFIPFDHFMELALYAPGLGYYSAGSAKLGKEGDFITAPEVSPLFSQCLARQCQQVIKRYKETIILELGAGSGVMAADMLHALEKLDCLPAEYWILETSADLRERQQRLLRSRHQQLAGRIKWLDKLPEKPVTGILLANEILDALPVRRVKFMENKLYEMFVGYDGNGFVWKSLPAGDELIKQAIPSLSAVLPTWPDDYHTEFNTRLPAFLGSLSDTLASGIMLFIDYGYPRSEYYHPQRTDGTLICHYRHRAHIDPFWYPGLQDISASVEFTAVAESAEQLDLEVKGFTSQASFLMSCGLEEVVKEIDGDAIALNTAQQIKRLTLPAEMGERFKVMALARNFEGPLTGIRLHDQRHRL